jgi:outer membrane lipoprotein SlyB
MFMKTGTSTLAAALTALAVTGCYNPNGTPDNTGTGVLTGAASGAALGAIIGAATHNVGEGAAIGAGSGAVLGGLIGHSADQQQEMRMRQQSPDTYQRAQAGTPLSLVDVKALAKAQISDDVIIAQIINSHTVYHLSANDLIDLHNAGVSDRVVKYMEDTPSLIPATPVATVETAPPPAPVEPMLVAPGPGYVWVGGEWVWNGNWYWRAGYWDVPLYPGYIWVGGYWGHGPRGYIYHGGHWGRR